MNKTEIYAEIQRAYDRDRSTARLESENRKKEIYNKIPRIEEIRREIDNTGIALAEIFVSGGDKEKSLNEFRQKCSNLEHEQAELLLEAGYPKDYFDIKYKCPKCSDTGYIDNKRCECFNKKLIEYYYDMSNISRIIAEENFDNFDISLYSEECGENGISPRDNIKAILSSVMNSLSNIDNTPVNIVFSGTSGLGKTYMSSCIAKYLIDRGLSVIYLSAYKLCDIMIKHRFKNDNSNEESYNLLSECDMLIIDDLGTEGINNQTVTELYNIINTRYLSGKSTIISTNFTMQDIYKAYSARIVSRIMGHYKFYKFFGKDLRIFK